MKKDRLHYLIHVWKQGNANPAEQKELNAWYADFEKDPAYTTRLSNAEREALGNRMWTDFSGQHLHKSGRQLRRYWSVAAAALILLAIATGLFFYTNQLAINAQKSAAISPDLLPGGNRATLTLSDGRRIDLSQEETGIMIGDQVVYTDGKGVLGDGVNGDPMGAASTQMMSLSTPRGGTYQITLSDGSKVWLNAASKLEYPNRFVGGERLVRLEGEAFFAIAKTGGDVPQPFRIEVGGQVIEVTGTQFNVSAYTDEPAIRTTLIEGAVTLYAASVSDGPTDGAGSSGTATIKLVPGEEGVFTNGQLSKRRANIQSTIAWKNGDFMFDNEPLVSIMNKIARWYDVGIVYENAPKDMRLYGIVSRSKNISTVLEILEMTEKVKFRIESPETGHQERRVVVMQ